ncbi:Immune inhibitor A peptidase M6 [Thermomonospora echinospora]|uniref:Zinc carboxypeptidase n=1 Tax=Thermomonospora echinospora TaxID=1992 RepID=A0A1H5XRZ3_9ACTN|nr:M14 family metallopeptidase [Thermomonospora echinospora]SEG14180.1 Immune inhibitor A peptidase M6 [Thermomonospora echinospora]
MRRVVTSCIAALTLGAGLMVAGPATAAPPGPGRAQDRLEVFTGQLTPAQLEKLRDLGLDHEDIALGKAADGKVAVEAVMSRAQGDALSAKGIPLRVKKIKGQTAAQRSRALAEQGGVFRPYSGPGNIREEIVNAAKAHPDIAQAVDIGRSGAGKPITAVRVSKGARKLSTPSKRPAVVYQATQHAREWITPETVRRQLHYFLDNYGKNAEITKIVDTTDLWFVPVVNVDGYDLTFDPEFRMWRKNVRDNDGDGQITGADGVDINRNFPYKWGYDNEGSAPTPESAVYRGPAPGSEPETKVQDSLVKRLRPKYMINYHSAAELLLYGVGWQTQTPSPDDHIFTSLLGDDAHPAVPGYDPDLGAELYTTNGDTDGHMQNNYGTLTLTPEMSTCETASNVDPDDQWRPEDCVSVFHFPDDEKLIQREFQNNLPLAIATAKSAHTPDDPVSIVGKTTPDMVVDAFDTSYGTKQPVAVEARRSLDDLRLRYRINGGSAKSTKVREWKGGERYGDENDVYFAEYRGTVRGAKAKDKVEVWFEARKKGKPVASEHFTYTVAEDIGGEVLVLAAEDVTGISPVQGVTQAKYAASYAKALDKAGYRSDVYDVDQHGRKAPHHLGVLSHYDAVIWETGDDIIPRTAGQPGGTAAKLAMDLELTVRDYLNEGGKLLFTGKYAGNAQSADGSYFYEPDVPAQPECAVRSDPPCLPMLNDFLQYYLGAYTYVDGAGSDGDGKPYPVKGTGGAFNGFASTLNGGDSANNQDHTASFLTTSSFLPQKEFPQFASTAPIAWERPGGAPYDPRTGAWYVYSQAADVSYKRLTRTVDLTGKSTGELEFSTSFETEADWDFMFVEAHTVGEDDWTTLPDANGHTSQETGESCASAWRTLHPFLDHYQGADCSPQGTTGAWHAASGRSNGWQDWSIDLSAYAGKKVELSITYVSDWGTQGIGVFLDDAKVTADGQTLAETSFEDGLGDWTVAGPPAGSAPAANDWTRSQRAFAEGAGVATEDTVYLGFGAEGLTTQQARTDFVKRAMRHLLR